MPDGDSERDRLLAEIGIDPVAPPPPRPPSAAVPAVSASILLPEPPPPPPPAPPFKLPRRLFGGLMALAGAAWIGVGLAVPAPLPLALGGLLLLPGLAVWRGRE